MLIGSRKWLSKQPADVQDPIREAGQRAQREQRRLWHEHSARAVAEPKGHDAVTNDVDVAAFQRAIAPVYRDIAARSVT